MSDQSSSIRVTAQTYQYLQDSCARLSSKIDEDRRELASLICEEKDSTGNHPLMEATRQLDLLKDQLSTKEILLAIAHVAPAPVGDKVAVGSTVRIRMSRCDGSEQPEEREFFIDGTSDNGRNDVQVITPYAPLGEAIMGAKPGKKCSFKTPGGNEMIAEVISVLN
ncbi:GreA/GreB family elongation factor [Candidatus Saccharibacteria bacterium]|nr:GreA/GreB family elongation factor [Candidatus Saccharibacteria bacterium]